MTTALETTRDELEKVLEVLPQRVASALRQRDDLEELLEVVLDLGRAPEARFINGDAELAQREVEEADLQAAIDRLGEFGGDNRAGLERTLHRISAIRNRRGRVIGLTCRVGRAVFGTIKLIEDLALSGKNLLLLGRPGVGKTTMLREMARVLSVEAHKRVIIVDTSNEIAGDGDVPHPAIGRARRMQVPSPAQQDGVMIEAVENHMPEVIVIDEMGTEREAAAARTIAERGVQLVATAHGNTLDNLIMNPTLSDLIGGIQTVTLGDQEARYRGTQKSVLERKGPPTFDVVVEIHGWNRLAVHDEVAEVVDQWLRGYAIAPEMRWMDEQGEIHREEMPSRISEAAPAPWRPDGRRPNANFNPNAAAGWNGSGRGGAQRRRPEDHRPEDDAADKANEVRVFLFGVGRDKLEAATAEAGMPVHIVNELRRADLVLTTKTHYRRGSQLVRIAEANGKPVCVLRKNSMPQLQDFLRTVVADWGRSGGRIPDLAERRDRPERDGRPERGDREGRGPSGASIERAMQEAEEAANRVLGGEPTVRLTPQRSHIRRLQHMLGQRYNVASVSQGREPERAVLFYRV